MPWVQKTFSDYDMPEDRTPDSYAFRIDEIWSGHVVDSYWTDERSEVERIVPSSLEQMYDVRVTHRYGETALFSPDGVGHVVAAPTPVGWGLLPSLSSSTS